MRKNLPSILFAFALLCLTAFAEDILFIAEAAGIENQVEVHVKSGVEKSSDWPSLVNGDPGENNSRTSTGPNVTPLQDLSASREGKNPFSVMGSGEYSSESMGSLNSPELSSRQ
ncbi:hypothetical protein [Rufibacter ruber]|uniref:hypothetical protein n=1 Tax=Rufibacter ruber TaxID=1783499 RepID=UPI000B15E1C1|nr:hypothetical protein [Rufibacter ruber]